MIAHLGGTYRDEGYLDFIDAANPELVQLGFYGAHFWGLVHTPQYKGYPASFPVQGIAECGDWFEARNQELRQRKIHVVGQFNVSFLVGDPDGPEGPRGFFKFYRDLWDEEELGPKPPVEDPIDFLERDRDGNPLVKNSYNIGGMKEYFACLRNPHWQAVLKAWMTRGIERGADGFIANYFYRHDCHCEHCQAGFREYLEERFTESEREDRFQVTDLEAHVFDEIVCWHKPEESTPLRREMLRWSQLSNKEAFDEVFIRHGRSLKPDLIVAQWNHLGNFNQISGDERCLLPADSWGAGEDYLWYSLGASGVYTDLENRVLADGTLQSRYLRGAFDDRPFTLGKYEGVRTRTAIAELAANGGAPMGLYARITDPEAREVFATYYGFLERYRRLFHASRSHAEVAVLYPRRAVHAGDLEPRDAFREAGKALLEAQVLFDVIPDDLAEEADLEKYAAVLRFEEGCFEFPDQIRESLSRIEAPFHVRTSANRPPDGGEVDLHFVNYNRKEFPPNPKNGRPNPGRGTKDENPLPVTGIAADLLLPEGEEALSVEFVTPENPDPVALDFETSPDGSRVQFEVPEFLVYGVTRVKTQPRDLEEAPVVAGITTVYRHNSHADVILGRLAETKSLLRDGGRPRLRMPRVFVDQFPDRDISRSLEADGCFQIDSSVESVLTQGTDALAVEGVLLVAEHGEYPISDTGQKIYPKRRLFSEILEVFDRSGRVVPVFNDKHLADNWEDAKWMHDEAKRRGIPMMAGSSLPGLWRYPPVDVPRDAALDEIVVVSFGSLDAYGFHAMEIVQCLAERRAGGETGIRRVQTVVGEAVWESELYDADLLEACLDRQTNQKRARRKPLPEIVKEPVLWVLDYEDGLRASVMVLNGAVSEWTGAWKLGDGTRASALFWTQEKRPFFHFSLLLDDIEAMIHTGKPSWPVERTLMTSGALDAALIAQRDGTAGWLETPHLAEVEYTSDWNWKQPPPPPFGRDHREK